jgi:hypothetical protein
MWTRDTNVVNDTEMFPKQFKIYGRPTADSSAGEIEIGKIGDIILSSQPSRSENLLISSAAVNSVINTNKVVYSQYRIEIYQNNSSGFSNKPLIGELRFYRPSSVQQYGNELTNWAENGAGHIIPSENSLYDIGSAEKKVRHLYLSSNSLNIGGVVLSSENDDIKIGENKLVKVTSEPIDGQGLVYSSNQWIPGTVGTSVTANPSSTPTTDLTKVTIDGIDYNVGQKRNYQYKQIQGSYVTSSVGLSYVDINGLDGSNTLQITTLQSDSKIRLHFILRAECSDSEGRNHHFHFQLRRTIQGVNTSLNADNITNYTPSLSNNEYSLYPNNQSTLDTFEIYYIDTLTDIDEGTTISYVPQIRWVSNGTPAFHLNTTVDSGGTSHENSLSISEAEEILTGPPLTVNNVAVSGTPNANDILQYNGSAWTNVPMQSSIVHEEGTVQVRVTDRATVGSHGSLSEPDVDDTFTLSYTRLGSFVELIGAFSIDGISDSNGYIIGRIEMEFVSPPSWLILTSDPNYGSGVEHGSTHVVGQLTSSHTSGDGFGHGITGDIEVLGNTSFQANIGIQMATSGDPNKMSLNMRCKLPSSSGSTYYTIPSGSVVSMVGSAPTSSDPDGTLKYDTNNGKLYLRASGGWVAFSKDL